LLQNANTNVNANVNANANQLPKMYVPGIDYPLLWNPRGPVSSFVGHEAPVHIYPIGLFVETPLKFNIVEQRDPAFV